MNDAMTDTLIDAGDTLFAGAWGRTDLPGGDDDAAEAEVVMIHASSSERRGSSDAAEERPDTLDA